MMVILAGIRAVAGVPEFSAILTDAADPAVTDVLAVVGFVIVPAHAASTQLLATHVDCRRFCCCQSLLFCLHRSFCQLPCYSQPPC